LNLDLDRKNFENIVFYHRSRLRRVVSGENPFRLFTRNERVHLVKHGILTYKRGVSKMVLMDKAREALERTRKDMNT